VLNLAKEGAPNLILNLTSVSEIDDDGLGALIVCHASVRRAGGALKILQPSRVHMALFVAMKLEGVFETFLDEQDAVDSFFPDRAVRPFDILAFVRQQKNHPSAGPASDGG
jgi:anti-sigma B factor antagonist